MHYHLAAFASYTDRNDHKHDLKCLFPLFSIKIILNITYEMD